MFEVPECLPSSTKLIDSSLPNYKGTLTSMPPLQANRRSLHAFFLMFLLFGETVPLNMQILQNCVELAGLYLGLLHLLCIRAHLSDNLLGDLSICIPGNLETEFLDNDQPWGELYKTQPYSICPLLFSPSVTHFCARHGTYLLVTRHEDLNSRCNCSIFAAFLFFWCCSPGCPSFLALISPCVPITAENSHPCWRHST